MTGAVSTVGIALVAAIAIILVREAGFRGAKLLSSVAIVLITLIMLGGFKKLLSLLSLTDIGGDAEEVIRLFLKIIGVGYVFGIGSDICREMGEAGVANALLGVGRVEILLISLPTFFDIFKIGMEYLR